VWVILNPGYNPGYYYSVPPGHLVWWLLARPCKNHYNPGSISVISLFGVDSMMEYWNILLRPEGFGGQGWNDGIMEYWID